MTVQTNLGLITLSQKSFQQMEQAAQASVLAGGFARFENGKLFYRGMEIVGKPFLAVKDELVQKMPPVSVISTSQVNDTIGLYNGIVTPEKPWLSTGAKILGGMAIAESVLSFVRCIWGLPDVGWEEMVESTGVFAGVLFVALDSQGFYGAQTEHLAAQTTDHNEKYKKAAAKLLMAIVSFISSAIYLIGKMAEKHWVAITSEATQALLSISGAFAAVALVIASVLAALGIHRCHEFAKRLKGYESDKEKLTYLLNAVTVSVDEKNALGNDQGKIAQRAKEKIEYVRARTSMKAVRMILQEAPELLQALNRNDNTVIDDVRKLIQDVVDEGTKKQLVYTVGLIIAILGFLSTVFALAATGGSLPLILLAVSIGLKAGLKFTNWWCTAINDPVTPYNSKKQFITG